jgi:hypothetical protein
MPKSRWTKNLIIYYIMWLVHKINGSPLHVAPTSAGSREGSDHFGSYVHELSLHFCKRLFIGLGSYNEMKKS